MERAQQPSLNKLLFLAPIEAKGVSVRDIVQISTLAKERGSSRDQERAQEIQVNSSESSGES